MPFKFLTLLYRLLCLSISFSAILLLFSNKLIDTSQIMTKKKKPSGDYANETKREIDILLKNLYFKPKSTNQQKFCKLIEEKEIIICSGPAGVGKSMLSVAKALELLKDPNNNYDKIILCTPAVEADEAIGFLKGSLEEKLAPYIHSTQYLFEKLLGKSATKSLMDRGFVEVIGLGFMRGINIDNAIVIAEEFQNATPNQVKTLLTRIGNDSKFIVSGDLEQSDRYKKQNETGLHNAFHRLENKGIDEIGFFRFDQSDIVRNKVISKILDQYKD